MNSSEEAEGKYQIVNEQAVQGQVVGDSATVHQYFGSVNYSTPSTASSVVWTPAASAAAKQVWNVPYPRNTLFTGRDDLLDQLANTLRTGQPAAISQPQAISGLGGIGKTQVALEYAYRYRHDYQAVLWAQAESYETLTTSFLELARLLNLPEQYAQESDQVIARMKQWLQRSVGWLLILDNADDLAQARDFLPPTFGGHVLLTTRAQAMGRFARRLEVETLPVERGREFLLRRAGVLAMDVPMDQTAEKDWNVACEICELLGGLPLALDQAGAYMEETGCGLAVYVKHYKQQRAKLLAQRRGLVNDHPLPVATTWSLSFEQVEQKSAAAADLLRLCAFLAPDTIPETIIRKGATHLGPQLATLETDDMLLDEAIDALRAYSLIRKDVQVGGEGQLSVHRLVQAVLRDQMDQESQKQWAERSILAISTAFPYVELQTWPQCEQLLPHAQAVVNLIELYHLCSLETAYLLNQTGFYLHERARYQEAEPLYKRALSIREQLLGTIDSEVATSLNNLAELYYEMGKYTEAEPLYERALIIDQQVYGAEHPRVATDLNNLALLYKSQGKYQKAEPFYERALAIREELLGAEHPATATSLNNLAGLYMSQGKYTEAKSLYERALIICEHQLGVKHPDTASSLNNLAGNYRVQGLYAEAEPLYKRALAICEQQLGAGHPNTAACLNNLALLYETQGQYSEAELLYKRALAICKQQLGDEHLNTASSLNNLAALYRAQGKYEEAKPLYLQALAIYEQQLGDMHTSTAALLNNLAELYKKQTRYREAEPLYQRASVIYEQQLGVGHPTTRVIRSNYASLLWEMERTQEAVWLKER